MYFNYKNQIKMQKSIKLSTISLITVSIIAVLFYFQSIKHQNESDRLSQALKTSHKQELDSISSSYKTEIAGLKIKVSQQESVILTKQEAIDAGFIEKEKYRKLYLKEVSNNLKLQAEIDVIKNTPLPEPQIIYIEDSTKALRLPFEYKYSDKYFSGGFAIDNDISYYAKISFSPEIIIGYKRNGLFKKPIPTASVLVESDNNYVEIKQIKSLTIEKETKWYENKWFLFGAGVATGYIINDVVH